MKNKLILIGPEEVGKTLISNILGDKVENFSFQYEPTQGVRILEIEIPISITNSDESMIEIDLWDCAGAYRYQSCWPVIQSNTDGVIFIYNPQMPNQLPQLELLYDYFVIQNGLSDNRCLLFVNERDEKVETPIILPEQFKTMNRKTINATSNPNLVKSEFINYVKSLRNIRNNSLW